ncbi:MAG TPA: LysR family transcriptional regulator [Steroidobacteraceae bacterium]|nr:LysR family transcriptional regulator [Steroidobacteraceae bacterium]
MQAPAVRFRVDFGRDGAVGPGKIALLEHIGTGGSLSQAARELGMSYRRAWQLLESLNSCFRERVVQSAKGGRGGGGARLTPFGRLLIRVYREFDAEVQKRAARSFRPVAGLARQPARATAPIVRLKDRQKA